MTALGHCHLALRRGNQDANIHSHEGEEPMAKYLVTYHGAGMPANPSPEMMQQVKAAFGAWLAEAGGVVVDPGAPIKMAAQVAKGAPAAPVEIGGYSILQAGSLDAVKAILAKHPFVGRGGTLQVSEILAV
jgi:hypothetical protein